MPHVWFLRRLALFAALAAAAPARAEDAADTLQHLRGISRPVVVLSTTAKDPRVAEQLAALDDVRSALAERDVAVLTEAQSGSRLRRSLGVEAYGFAVVLVGKDGTVKEVWHAPVDPRTIFALIDRMPMRREEMRGDR